MTVSLDDSNQVLSQVKAGIGALRKSTTSFAIAGTLISFFNIVSGIQELELEDVMPLFFFGSLTQVKQKSDERHSNNESSQRYIANKVDGLGYKLKESEYITRNLETDVANNLQQTKAIQAQVVKLAESQESLSAQLKDVKAQLDRQFLSVGYRINQIEARFGDCLLRKHFAPFRNKLSRLNHQYLEAKLLTPDNLELLQQLQLQLDNLEAKVGTFKQQQSKRIPTANECKEIELPAKKPERPLEDSVAIFIDGTNISICATKVKSWKCRLNWEKLFTLLRGQSADCDARFYDSMSNKKAGFLRAIAQSGYEVTSKWIIKRQDKSAKGNLDTELSNDVMACAHLYDTFVLVSCDGDFTDTVIRLRAMGKRVEVVSFKECTSKKLIKSADSYLDLTNLQNELGLQK